MAKNGAITFLMPCIKNNKDIKIPVDKIIHYVFKCGILPLHPHLIKVIVIYVFSVGSQFET